MIVDLILKENLHLIGDKELIMIISKALNNSLKHSLDLVLILLSQFLVLWVDLVIKEEEDQENLKCTMVTTLLWGWK